LIISKKVVKVIASGSGSFIHGFTYSSHPVSVAAGRAVLNYMVQLNLVEAADSSREHSIATALREELGRLSELKAVGDVRGVGLLWAVEFVADRAAKTPFPASANFSGRVAQAAVARGLLVYPVQGCADGDSGDHILVAPPVVISQDQVGWAVEKLAEAIDEATVRP